MADQRIVTVLGDGTTRTQLLGIDASGRPTVNVNGTVTVSATNLDIRDLTSVSDSVTVVATALDIRALASGTDSVTVVATALDIRALDSGTDSVTVTGSVTVSATDLDIRDLTEATDAILIYANTAKDGSGTSYVPLVDADGHLQVDVLSGAGSTTPGTPVVVRATASALAAGASTTTALQTADLGGSTRKLTQLIVTSSAPLKIVLQSVVDGTGTGLDVFFTRAGETLIWGPPHPNYYETAFAAEAGFDGWRVIVTNLDGSQAADVYASIAHEG